MQPTLSGPTKQRFGESAKFLPVLFVVCNILGLYLIYMLYHAVPKLAQPTTPTDIRFNLSRPQGIDFDEALRVSGVHADGQADGLGVVEGWRAVAADGEPVASLEELFAKIGAAKAKGSQYFTIAFAATPPGQARLWVIIETIIFNAVTGLLVWCYVSCILIHPGTVPDEDEDPSWQYVPQDSKADDGMVGAASLQETKRSGDRRHCKWCAKYKPDRCHHCRVCRTCILKMDHHCPWIYNCVGFNNHKSFFLLLFYATIDCQIITWTMLPSVKDSFDSSTPFTTMFLLLFGETLASFIGVLVTAFFSFHIWLMMKAMTTIEFCEKSLKRTGYDSSVYDRGPFGNIQSVLGDQPCLWLLPGWGPPGRGLDFPSEDSDRSKSSKSSKGQKGYGATSETTKTPPHTSSPVSRFGDVEPGPTSVSDRRM